MSTETNQSQERKNSDFGLPQAEFRPIPERRGRGLTIIAIILVVMLILSAGAAYWFFYHAPASSQETAYLNTNEIPTAASDFIEDGEIAPSPTLADDKQGDKDQHSFVESEAIQEKAVEKKSFPTYSTDKPSKGTITKVDKPQGHYYVIIGSFIDDDLALDYANQLADQGIDISILAPEQKGYFCRVAVAKADTFYAANEKIEDLKSSHGDKIWVKKY